MNGAEDGDFGIGITHHPCLGRCRGGRAEQGQKDNSEGQQGAHGGDIATMR